MLLMDKVAKTEDGAEVKVNLSINFNGDLRVSIGGVVYDVEDLLKDYPFDSLVKVSNETVIEPDVLNDICLRYLTVYKGYTIIDESNIRCVLYNVNVEAEIDYVYGRKILIIGDCPTSCNKGAKYIYSINKGSAMVMTDKPSRFKKNGIEANKNIEPDICIYNRVVTMNEALGVLQECNKTCVVTITDNVANYDLIEELQSNGVIILQVTKEKDNSFTIARIEEGYYDEAD